MKESEKELFDYAKKKRWSEYSKIDAAQNPPPKYFIELTSLQVLTMKIFIQKN